MDFFKSLWSDFMGTFGKRVELGTNSVTTLNIVVWAMFLGFLIAIAITLYNKLVVGKVVRALVSRKAHEPSCAMTLGDVKCDSKFIRFALRKNGSLRRIVREVQDTEAKCDNVNFEIAKFYIPQKFIRRAESIYGKSDLTPKTVILSVVGLLAITMLAFILIPYIVQLLANFIGSITPSGDNIL